MAIRLGPNMIQHSQQIDVASPGGGNRIIINSGALNINIQCNASGDQLVTVKETYTVLLAPSLQSTQFRQAIATAALSRTTTRCNTPGGLFSMEITDVDADWDDESHYVELRVEVSVSVSGAQNTAKVSAVEFQVTTFAVS